MKQRERFLPFIILSLLLSLYFWEIIVGRRYFWEDILYHYYPYHYFLFSSLAKFSLPLWNPFLFSGMPFLGDVQSQVFYPLNWLLAIFFSPTQSFVYWLVEMKVLLHFLLGGIFLYFLLRDLKLSPNSSFFSALAFIFSGFMITHLIHLTMVTTFIWLPLILLFTFRTFKRKRIRDACFAGIFLGISNLASHPQITLYIISTLFLLFFYNLANWLREKKVLFQSHLPLFLLIFLLGFGLSAIQYLPSFEYAKHTLRETMTFEESAEVSLPFHFPLLLLIPKFFGSLTGDGTDSVFFWGGKAGYYYWETAIYLGIIPLILAIFGISFSRARERIFFLVLVAISLLAGLGKNTPFYKLIFYLLPGFNRFRIPARFAGLATFGMAVLAGFGMEAFLKLEDKNQVKTFRKLLIIFLLIALFFWLLLLFGISGGKYIPEISQNIIKQYNIFLLFLIASLILFLLRSKRRGKLLSSIACGLTFFDLALFGQRFPLSSLGPEDYYPQNQLVRQLQEERRREIFRINARQNGYMILKRNEGMIQGLELLEGYTPLGLADYATFNIPREVKCDLLNAKYKIKVDEARKSLTLVLNPTYLPRAKMFYNYIVERDRKRILEILSNPEFDYKNCLILEKEPERRLEPLSILPANKIEIQRYSANEIRLRVATEKPGFLLLSEIYYPEWKVRVNGKEREIYRADYLLRAVFLEGGEHNIIFYYDKKTLRIGAGISLLSIFAICGLLLLDRRRATLD